MTKQKNKSGQKDLQNLRNFSLDNKDLEELESIISEFNIFKVLKKGEKEETHSNFLAWLMNPSETHLLGNYFLSAFLEKAVTKKVEISSTVKITTEFSEERKRFDILVEDEKNNLVCVIENKVQADLDNKQLNDYKDKVSKRFPKYKIIFIFLSAKGERPESKDWIPLTYDDVFPIIKDILKTQKDLNKDVLTFISHYKNLLRRYIMKDSDIKKLCNKIYKEHKDPIDLIYENVLKGGKWDYDKFVKELDKFVKELKYDVDVKERILKIYDWCLDKTKINSGNNPYCIEWGKAAHNEKGNFSFKCGTHNIFSISTKAIVKFNYIWLNRDTRVAHDILELFQNKINNISIFEKKSLSKNNKGFTKSEQYKITQDFKDADFKVFTEAIVWLSEEIYNSLK